MLILLTSMALCRMPAKNLAQKPGLHLPIQLGDVVNSKPGADRNKPVGMKRMEANKSETKKLVKEPMVITYKILHVHSHCCILI